MSQFDMLIQGLYGSDADERDRALVTFARLGERAIPLLVAQAVKPGLLPHQRVRILDVIQKIGGPLGVDEFFAIHTLLTHRSKHVRIRTAGVMVANHQRQGRSS